MLGRRGHRRGTFARVLGEINPAKVAEGVANSRTRPSPLGVTNRVQATTLAFQAR